MMSVPFGVVGLVFIAGIDWLGAGVGRAHQEPLDTLACAQPVGSADDGSRVSAWRIHAARNRAMMPQHADHGSESCLSWPLVPPSFGLLGIH